MKKYSLTQTDFTAIENNLQAHINFETVIQLRAVSFPPGEPVATLAVGGWSFRSENVQTLHNKGSPTLRTESFFVRSDKLNGTKDCVSAMTAVLPLENHLFILYFKEVD